MSEDKKYVRNMILLSSAWAMWWPWGIMRPCPLWCHGIHINSNAQICLYNVKTKSLRAKMKPIFAYVAQDKTRALCFWDVCMFQRFLLRLSLHKLKQLDVNSLIKVRNILHIMNIFLLIMIQSFVIITMGLIYIKNIIYT